MSRPLFFIAVIATMIIGPPLARAQSDERPQVMVVGVAHFVAKADLHNSTWGSSSLSPAMQAQIGRVTDALARFKPNKVMIEARANDPVYVERYQAYRQGRYHLGPNEREQFAYRLAGALGLPTIYPIDSTGSFPFDYESVKAAAARNGQSGILRQADAGLEGVIRKMNGLERASDLVGTLRYLNSSEQLKPDAGWYLYVDLIGNGANGGAGHVLTSNWYARNLQIFANIARDLEPGDRAIVFIGAGHASMLRPMIAGAPFLTDVDPEAYLPMPQKPVNGAG